MGVHFANFRRTAHIPIRSGTTKAGRHRIAPRKTRTRMISVAATICIRRCAVLAGVIWFLGLPSSGTDRAGVFTPAFYEIKVVLNLEKSVHC
jgi:hypothetical protein